MMIKLLIEERKNGNSLGNNKDYKYKVPDNWTA